MKYRKYAGDDHGNRVSSRKPGHERGKRTAVSTFLKANRGVRGRNRFLHRWGI